MLRSLRLLAAAVVLSSTALATGCAGVSAPPVEYASASPAVRAHLADLARRAVSRDPADSAPAIAQLRAEGPAGLDALFDYTAQAKLPPDAPEVRNAFDRVARQRDAQASCLYWYTDLNEAVRVARALHRPILSLRLLGNLDEELSCANSRFFRTTLYPDPRVGALLRAGFVLHWSSERPAPRITIDFGDGRRMERTLTGNSVHYVLDEEGRPVDALPGLYGPAAFLRGLADAGAVAQHAAQLPDEARSAYLRTWHAQARAGLEAAWAAELTAMGIPTVPPPAPVQSDLAAPPAMVVANTAPSKSVAEAPVVAALQGSVLPLPTPVSPETWSALVARHTGDANLGAESRAAMRRKISSEVDATGTHLVPLDAATFQRRVTAFERVLAEDTVRNEITLHRTLHTWLSARTAPHTLENLNRRVYASLFLTPRRDPWLGLLVEDGYTAIDNEGLVLGPQAARP